MKEVYLEIANFKYFDEVFLIKKDQILSIVAFLFISKFFILMFFLKYKRNYLENIKIIKKVTQELNTTKKNNFQQRLQSVKLEAKLNDSLDELYNLAKKNDYNFYNRFQKIHTNFQTNLLKIDQNLQSSELKLLALIYLDFEAKEIADITYKSTRTIQNRKYKLRKKLSISSSEDFSIWLKENCT